MTTNHDDFSAPAEALVEKFARSNGEAYTALAFVVAPNLPNGCSWGFVTSEQIGQLGLGSAADVPADFRVIPLRAGYMVFTDFQKIVMKIQNEMPLFQPKIIEQARQHRVTSVEKLNKYFSKSSGKIRLGFFCVNDSPTITIGGTVYPAFNVDLDALIKAARAHNLNFVVEGRVISPSGALQHQGEFLKSLLLAPSGNAIMVDLQK